MKKSIKKVLVLINSLILENNIVDKWLKSGWEVSEKPDFIRTYLLKTRWKVFITFRITLILENNMRLLNFGKAFFALQFRFGVV